MRKIYGLSKIDSCPFCNKQSVTKNKQGVPVCNLHKEALIPDIKCACGEYLEILSGKYGVFFKCINCGNISMKRALDLAGEGNIFSTKNNDKNRESHNIAHNSYVASTESKKYLSEQHSSDNKNRKEKIILPDDPEYFD